MWRAGVRAYERWAPDSEDAYVMVAAVFFAMNAAKFQAQYE